MTGPVSQPRDPPPAEGSGSPRVDITGAAWRHWPLIVVPTLLLVALAVAVSLSRSPTYTAETELIVGRIDFASQSVPGFAEASETLAETYSRSISAEEVIVPVSRDLGVSRDEVRSRLSAAPIAGSAIIRVEGTGDTRQDAIDLASSAGPALTDYVGTLTTSEDESEELLEQYQRAAGALNRAIAEVDRLRAEIARSPTPQARRDLQAAQVRAQTARLLTETQDNLYRVSRQDGTRSNLVDLLTPATAASSDQSSVLQRLIFIALVAGLAIGLALALARDAARR